MNTETIRIADATYSRIFGDNQGRPMVSVTYDDGDRFVTYAIGKDVAAAWAEVDTFGRQLTKADVWTGAWVVIHRGPIPSTDVGHHWFESAGERFGVTGWPHGINKGWSYEIVDVEGRKVDDGCYTLDEIRAWAARA